MNEKNSDLYEVTSFPTEEAFLKEIDDMEEHSQWIAGIQSSELRLESIDGPLAAAEAAQKYSLDVDLTVDTAANGTSLIICTGRKYELVRGCAVPSIGQTAKIFGSALGRMPAWLYAETLNNAFSVAQGSSLMLMRYGKCSAMHSNAEGGYEIMPISKLLKITRSMIDRRFGERTFKGGENRHDFTRCTWTLPDAQASMLLNYEAALNRTSQLPIEYMPAIRFSSSDTGDSCAILEPLFLGKGDVPLRFVDGVKVKHTKRGEKNALEDFAEQAEDLFSKFEESVAKIEKLSEVEVQNPANALVSVCRKFGISKKYGDYARDAIETLAQSGRPVTAHDLYVCLASEVINAAYYLNSSTQTINNLEEAIAKVLKIERWEEHDVGGLVAWKD